MQSLKLMQDHTMSEFLKYCAMQKKRQTQRTMCLHGFVYMECLNVKINNKKRGKIKADL